MKEVKSAKPTPMGKVDDVESAPDDIDDFEELL